MLSFFYIPTNWHLNLNQQPARLRVLFTPTAGFVESFAFGGTAPTESLEEGVQEKKVGEPKSAWALPYCVGMSHLAEPSCLGNAMEGAFKKGGIYEIGQQKGSSGIPFMTHNLHTSEGL